MRSAFSSIARIVIIAILLSVSGLSKAELASQGETSKAIIGNICKNEIQPIKGYPTEMQEAALITTTKNISKKTVEIYSQVGSKGEDQLFALRIMALGNYIISEMPVSSQRLKVIFVGFSDIAEQLTKGTITFENFKEKLGELSKKIELIESNNSTAKAVFRSANAKDVKDLSDCVIATAMYSIASKTAK